MSCRVAAFVTLALLLIIDVAIHILPLYKESGRRKFIVRDISNGYPETLLIKDNHDNYEVYGFTAENNKEIVVEFEGIMDNEIISSDFPAVAELETSRIDHFQFSSDDSNILVDIDPPHRPSRGMSNQVNVKIWKIDFLKGEGKWKHVLWLNYLVSTAKGRILVQARDANKLTARLATKLPPDINPTEIPVLYEEPEPSEEPEISGEGLHEGSATDESQEIQPFCTMYSHRPTINPFPITSEHEVYIQRNFTLDDAGQPKSFVNGKPTTNTINIDFKANKTVIYVHGFHSSSSTVIDFVNSIVNALYKEPVNVILFDWRTLAQGSPAFQLAYAATVRRRRRSFTESNRKCSNMDKGQEVSGYRDVVDQMQVARGYLAEVLELVHAQTDHIHCIGHSLGAHLCAQGALEYKEKTGKSISRITGLDPARPCFQSIDNPDPREKLTKEKADFVDVMHTDWKGEHSLGINEELGDVDFFVETKENCDAIETEETETKERNWWDLAGHIADKKLQVDRYSKKTMCHNDKHSLAYHIYVKSLLGKLANWSLRSEDGDLIEDGFKRIGYHSIDMKGRYQVEEEEPTKD